MCISGGGGTGNAVASGADHSVLAGVQNNASLIELAAAGSYANYAFIASLRQC